MRRLFLLSFLVAMFWPQLAHAQIVEAESMTQPPGSEIQVPLGWASGNQYVTLHEQGTLQTQVTLPQSDLIRVSAREGRDCGDVSMTVRIDGSTVFSGAVSGVSFALYTASLNLQAGSHSLEIEFPSDTDERCDTTLRVDAASFREVAPSYRPPYDARALFNQPVPHSKPDDPGSDAFIAEWIRTVRANPTSTHLKTSGEVPAINRTAGCPFRSFQTGNVSGTFPLCSDLKLGSGSDHPTIALNGTDQLRIWQATWDGTTLRGTLGGRFCDRNDGGLDPNGQLCLGQAYAGGGAGNRLTYRAGLNEPADFLQTTWPRHAGRAAFDGRFIRSSSRPPARGSDQNSTASYALPMGSMLQIKAHVNCDQRSTEVARDLCHQYQTYGVMLADGSASNQVVLYFEDDVTANWTQVFGSRCSGSTSWSCRIRPGSNALDGLPWNASDWRVVAAPVSATAW